jgi:ABC-type multidrug transport system fused ATPase/permease subunit
VGMVGSGKSTLIKLAAGIFSPTTGTILVNGKPLRGYAQADLRAHAGYIPQEATLFSESVRDNVAFGRQVTPEMLVSSLELARVREEMEALPGGLDQVLGQRGLTVSGGQKQRLAIARALAGAPDLLLMDDCTSALDAENERAFWELFRERFPHAACLIVTHRLATALQADVIYMLHKGRIVGAGTHAELVETCPQYRSFLTREELEAALAMAT